MVQKRAEREREISSFAHHFWRTWEQFVHFISKLFSEMKTRLNLIPHNPQLFVGDALHSPCGGNVRADREGKKSLSWVWFAPEELLVRSPWEKLLHTAGSKRITTDLLHILRSPVPHIRLSSRDKIVSSKLLRESVFIAHTFQLYVRRKYFKPNKK